MAIPIVDDVVGLAKSGIGAVTGTFQWLAHTFIGTPVKLVQNLFGIGTSGAEGAIEGGQMGVKWGLLGGLAFGAYQASQEGKDVVGGALDGAMKGGLALGAGGALIGTVAGAAPAALETATNLGSNVSATIGGLFPNGGGVQNLPSGMPPKSSGKNVG